MANPPSSHNVEDVVLRYFATVSDLTSSEEDLVALVAPALRVVEHPNPVTPRGAVRDLGATLQGFRAGKALLREQSFDVHELLTAGQRAAVRATWRGVVGVDSGPYRVGQELVAHIAALVTVEDGRVLEHETFDCYEPIAAP
ncbi:nuclear transport factor 2 family protein [Geodermatophilus sp. SYSU D00815]